MTLKSGEVETERSLETKKMKEFISWACERERERRRRKSTWYVTLKDKPKYKNKTWQTESMMLTSSFSVKTELWVKLFSVLQLFLFNHWFSPSLRISVKMTRNHLDIKFLFYYSFWFPSDSSSLPIYFIHSGHPVMIVQLLNYAT